LKDLNKTVIKKYKKIDIPKDTKSEEHMKTIQDYLNKILNIENLKDDTEIRRAFKLDYFFEGIKKQEEEFEAVQVPE